MGCPEVYNDEAALFFRRYEAIDAADIRAVLDRWVPANARVLELGCGSGRDARHMKAKGARVTATDGSPALLALAKAEERRLAIDGTPVDWQTLTLPVRGEEPDFLQANDEGWDVVFTSGMLQHLDDNELRQTAADIDRWANEKTTVIVIVPLNHPGSAGRKTHTRDILDYVTLFERMGFREASRDIKADTGAPGFHCEWATLVFVRADKNDEATKRFRTIIEDDQKTATYKLALLRALCALNRTMPRAVRYADGQARLPMGLVIEKWIEYYWQLAGGARMPLQMRRSMKDGRLRDIAFLPQLNRVRTLCGNNWAAFNRLLATGPEDRETQKAVSALLTKVRHTIKAGPLTYITDAENRPIFTYPDMGKGLRAVTRLDLRESYGEIAFPAELWQELNRIAPWLEDSIVLEWARVSARFETLAAAGEKEALTLAAILERMMPEPDERDTGLARAFYLDEIRERTLRCIWSHKRLKTDTLAVDHMLPWARFHTNDLWNLMPALNTVNGAKSDRIPTEARFLDSADDIIGAWRRLEDRWSSRFRAEAEIALLKPSESLPKKGWEAPLFDALLIVADNGARQTQAARFS